ncbi:glycosyltransferase family 4 protein [Anoxybacteroides amylolyticum]|uniref:Spore coat protein SA n=1 Tax=Anoxybacteroides amylolyticum TaxID=294699 RepID=A0A161HU26_9BACL|nr:glycosyltransferase family 4 protein [Anoxybacillus amylolyticus]ANB59674.1 spore coat protein SA [Anoxybacillus amylolyticus]
MNIAYICTEKLPSPAVKGGAIQLMIDGISPFIVKTHHLTIFSITDPSLPMNEMTNGIEYIRFPKETYEQDVANTLRNRTFDVIHVFNRPARVSQYKEAAQESAIVLSLHNDMFSPLKIAKEKAEQALKDTSILTSVSNYIKQTVRKRYDVPEEKIRVIYSGVDGSQFIPVWTEEGKQTRNEIRQMLGLKDEKVILFIGRLSKTKGPHVLLRAMRKVLSRHPNAVLVIAGGRWFSENSWDDYVRELHRLAIPFGNHIRFTNYVPAWQVPHLLLSADVFVCSSQWHEPLARVHYEAMAAGIPIITTNRGGNAEIVQHKKTGFVIDDYANPSAFAEAIHYMLVHESEAEAMARRSRAEVEEKFLFSHVAERLMAVYEEAAKKRCLY